MARGFEGDAWQVIVGLTGAFGGGAEIDADPADGRLDVVAIEARSRARLVLRGYGLRTGRVEDQRGVFTASRGPDRGRDRTRGRLQRRWRARRQAPADFAVEPRAFEVVVGR